MIIKKVLSFDFKASIPKRLTVNVEIEKCDPYELLGQKINMVISKDLKFKAIPVQVSHIYGDIVIVTCESVGIIDNIGFVLEKLYKLTDNHTFQWG